MSLRDSSLQQIFYTANGESATIIQHPVSDSSHHQTEDGESAVSQETLRNNANEEDNVSQVPPGPSQSDDGNVGLPLELNVDGQGCDVGLLEAEQYLSQSGSEYTLNDDSESDPSFEEEEEDDRTTEEIASSLSISLV